MPRFKYAVYGLDPDRTAIASGRDIDISPKAAREICRELSGRYLDQAMAYLEGVRAKEEVVPYRRYKKKVGHKQGIQRWPVGRYPVKAAEEILKVLRNVENNAEFKGLDITRLRVIHACAHEGRKTKRFFTRAFGRTSPKTRQTVHVEIAVEEE
ncbi:MAG: 50S ribosomal protein L22 [Candidatus Heimdallarchaeota archaeon]